MIAHPASISKINNQQSKILNRHSSIVNPPFASKYRTLLPTEAELIAELIAELERERRVIEQKLIGGDT